MPKNMAKSRTSRRAADGLLASLIERARDPVFYAKFEVADTLDGRFDILTLHAALLIENLERRGRRDLSQELIDGLFTSLDEGLRELGAGDIGMGRRMKKLANAFYGRLYAYRAAVNPEETAEAILRNVFRGRREATEAAHSLARYMTSAREALASSAPEDAAFGPLPASFP